MAITLIVNPGSSSKKFAIYKDKELVLDAYVERLGEGFEMCTAVDGMQQKCELLDKKDFGNSLGNFLELAKEGGLITDLSQITKVAVRVVAPGTFFQAHKIVNPEFVTRLKEAERLAPLHIPHVIREIESINKFLPNVKIVAVSDSAFHSTLPKHVRQYSILSKDSEEFDIYHFGYHGLSVSSVIKKAKHVSKKNLSKVIVCHIGSGVSITALENGLSIDTTMGYAPGSGLVMGSRAGDLPTGALLALMQSKNMKVADALIYLQSSGGLFGLAGEADLRILMDKKARGDQRSTQALQSFIYSIQKAIGGYVAILGGLDTLIFTATASERNSTLRSLIVDGLGGLNIKLNTEKNEVCLSRDGVISDTDAAVEVLVIKTDEAREIFEVSESL
jgi:acetate kinase